MEALGNAVKCGCPRAVASSLRAFQPSTEVNPGIFDVFLVTAIETVLRANPPQKGVRPALQPHRPLGLVTSATPVKGDEERI